MKKIALLLLLLLAGGAYYGYRLYNKPHSDMHRLAVDFHLSARELFTAFSEDEAGANGKYLDKVIAVTGQVLDVQQDESGKISVTLDSGDAMFGVVCQLDDLTPQDSAGFQPGEQVTLKGLCTGMLMDVVLVRCVLMT